MKNVTEILFGRCLTFDAVYTTSESLKERKIYIFSVLYNEQLKFHPQLSWAWKTFYNPAVWALDTRYFLLALINPKKKNV